MSGFMGIIGFAAIFYIVVVIMMVGASVNKRNNKKGGNIPKGQPDKYKTINSHYSPSTLYGHKNKTNTISTAQVNKGEDHNHAYEHKVEPIDEASVHEIFEDRKEAYRDRKAQMRADLPKSSYSEAEMQMNAQNIERAATMGRKTARSGDNGYIPNRSEEAKKCTYCGAINIVPWEWRSDKKEVYSCYFCRQDLV